MQTKYVAGGLATKLGRKRGSRLKEIGRVVFGLRLGTFGVLVILLMALGALAAPWVAPFPPEKSDFALLASPPGTAGHLLGSDVQGRDILSRVVYGARVSML